MRCLRYLHCACAVLAKNMAATYTHLHTHSNTLRFCREDNPLYVLLYDTAFQSYQQVAFPFRVSTLKDFFLFKEIFAIARKIKGNMKEI